MIPAKNNIIVQIEHSKPLEYAVMNPISGSFDLMDEEEYDLLIRLDSEELPGEFRTYLLERGYAYESSKEQEAAIDKAYEEFKAEVGRSQVQLMLVPTYGCNLACTYCFQNGIEDRKSSISACETPLMQNRRQTLITKEQVDAFFKYAEDNFTNGKSRPFITLFGGEPLVDSPAQRDIIEYIVDKCVSQNFELSAVTNGYDFIRYMDILKKASIKEIQFTLDGSREVHDRRRATANRRGTFDRIVAGIEAAVRNNMPVNLRSVVDLENISDLVHLAGFLDEKGWLDLPPELFKTQLGRNYELFECYAKPQHLMTQVELWGRFASLSREYPVLAKFHRPDFKGIRHLVDTGEMYMASFDTCPACKTEWVFDLYGHIYGCTASCGREEYRLGTFWPEARLDHGSVDMWRKRDVKSISKCTDCKYDVICGGGCGVVAASHNGGNVLSPDCRPVQELLEIGINHYIGHIHSMAEEDTREAAGPLPTQDCCGADKSEEKEVCCCGMGQPAVSGESEDCCSPGTAAYASWKAEGCCSPTPADTPRKTEGCIICGQELIYSTTASYIETCSLCGRRYETYVKCPNGHYICDSCHSLDILGKVEQLLAASKDKDPVLLAQKVFELPGLNMHGPEYHSIVPAVLVAAWQNVSGKRDISKIREAIRRGKDIKGGSCGFNGNCGSGVGSGIAASVIEDATPMTRRERGQANRATGYALLEISRHGGPRCCKREAITSIETFTKVTEYFKGIQTEEYHCRQYGRNKHCIRRDCPYFPAR